MNFFEFLLGVAAVFGITVIGGLFLAVPMMPLMNGVLAPSLLQEVFGVTSVTFEKVWGLNVLAGLVLAAGCALKETVSQTSE